MFLDIDDTIIQVHVHPKEGAGFGYSGVRGLNALLATLTTAGNATVIIGLQLTPRSQTHRRRRTGHDQPPLADRLLLAAHDVRPCAVAVAEHVVVFAVESGQVGAGVLG